MEPIAIVGIGCRFPGAKNPEAFWQLLRNGVDAITPVPRQRWDVDALYDPEPATPGKMNTRYGGFLEQVDRFDPSFFGISPREAERMDPQQRLVLEVAWEALENAGLVPSNLAGSQTGVFIGCGNYDYAILLSKNDLTCVNAYDGTGNTIGIAANRLSYVLNLRGPSMAIETSCSSSLVAIHLACRSLHSQETNLCLVGAVSLMLTPEQTITYSQARMMAADGRCKTFDVSADGYVRGEGCGVVVLKRLSDAIRDGDHIQAIIKGSAVNQDGLSNGLTAPNGPSQQAVIRKALENANVQPEEISYIEAHGTGTSLGDPIEVSSLKAVLMKGRSPKQPCWIGSVKTNIGHLEAVAGLAGLIKVVLSLQNKEIPPHLHLKQMNPYISFAGTTFAIPSDLQPWNVATRRLAGVSSFGFGGTNAHVILEEAPSNFGEPPILNFGLDSTDQNHATPNGEEPRTGVTPKSQISEPKFTERPLHILALSAKSEKALEELAQSYQDFLAAHPDIYLADVCFTANTKREHFEQRIAVVAESTKQLRSLLSNFAANETTKPLNGTAFSRKRPKVAFLFTGQGSQYVNMGRQLYEQAPIFRASIDRCDEILRQYLEKPLLSVLYPQQAEVRSQKSEVRNQNGDHSPDSWILDSESYIDQTAYAQPALFALEYALCKLWLFWGITPDVVMGHSVGEYVAACIAGVFSLEDGLKLIATRASLMQALPPDGEMVAVFASLSQVQAVIQPYAQQVAVAAVNGPLSIVISGKHECIEAIAAVLEAQGVKTKKLQVSHAFHSPLMAPMLREFEQVAASVTYSQPKIKLVSNLTGSLATKDIATAEYWVEHVRQPVKFAASMETLHQQGYEMFVEIGPKPTLLGMAQTNLEFSIKDSQLENNDKSSANPKSIWLPSLRPGQEDWQQLLQSLGELYKRGVSVDWLGFDRDYLRRRVVLPTYPFQRQRYWFEKVENGHKKADSLSQNTLTPIVNLLNQGDTKKLVTQLERAGEFAKGEMELLPRVLEILVKQHHQQLSAASLQDLYQIEWQPKSRQSPTDVELNQASQPGSWLIFADKGGVGQALAALLQQQGNNCVLVYADGTSTNPGQEARVMSLNPAAPDDFEHLVQEVVTSELPLRGVIHLWSLEAGASPELTISALEQAQALGVGSVVHLLQALIKHQNPTPPAPQLWLVTRGAVPAASSLPNVAQSPLWGLGKVIALEHPKLWGGMIDLAPDAPPDETQKLLAEIRNSCGEDHLAFRDGRRYVARLVTSSLPESRKVQFRSDGTYLITGGLGALGVLIAQWMVEQGVQHLVLTGRSKASPQAQETINQMEQAGAKILATQADVSDRGDMVRVLEEALQQMPPLRGIVHAAGIIDDGILLQQNWERFTKVMSPKVTGTWNLHTLTQDLPLDFFVCFSSISSLLGSPGQGNYAAANAFMDALAHYRKAQKLPSLSINWGQWSSAGMATALGNRLQARIAAQGIGTIEPTQGLQVLKQLLGQTNSQVGFFPVEWSVFKQQLSAPMRLPLLSELIGDAPQEEVEQTTQNELLQRLEEASPGDRNSVLITHIQSEVASVLGLELEQLPDPSQGFFDMGMDSLMAVELKNRLDASLGCSLPATLAFESPSINELAEYLAKEVLKWESAATAALLLQQEVDERTQALSEIEQLPEDEVEASIAEKLSKLESLLKNN